MSRLKLSLETWWGIEPCLEYGEEMRVLARFEYLEGLAGWLARKWTKRVECTGKA